jgi:hypothetical protein
MNSQNLNIKITDDDTKFRILGDTNYPINRPTNYQYIYLFIILSYGKG